MATIPKVKVTFDADFDELKKGVKGATAEVEGFGDKVADFGRKAAAAFAIAAAAAAAYLTKIAVDGVKAAIEDEQAQVRLATALRDVTGATEAQIVKAETFISQLSMQTGIADDKLRPAMQRLALSTNDVGAAQELLDLSTRVSINSGKELEAVAAAVAKAQDGNTTSLAKLGIGLSAAELQGKSFGEVVAMINAMYPDLGANTDTAAFKMAQLNNSFNEAKEKLGFALLPMLVSFVDYINQNILPAFNAFIDGLTGDYSVVSSLDETNKSAFALGATLNTLFKSIAAVANVFSTDGKKGVDGFIQALQILANVASVVVTIIKELVSFIVEMANQVIGFLNLFGAGIAKIRSIDSAFGRAFGSVNVSGGTNPIQSGSYLSGSSFQPRFDPVTGKIMTDSGGGGGGGTSGSTSTFGATSALDLLKKLEESTESFTKLQFLVDTNAISYKDGTAAMDKLVTQFRILEEQAAVLTGSGTVSGTSDSASMLGTGTTTINLTVTGAIDPEGTSRTIVNTLNDSYYRGTLGALSLAGLTP
jgi:hypothetical protein